MANNSITFIENAKEWQLQFFLPSSAFPLRSEARFSDNWKQILTQIRQSQEMDRSSLVISMIKEYYSWKSQVYDLICAIYQLGFPGDSSGKEPTCQCRRCKRCRFNPWVRKIPWKRVWWPTPVLCLETPMHRGYWWATVHGSQRLRHDWSNLVHTHVINY